MLNAKGEFGWRQAKQTFCLIVLSSSVIVCAAQGANFSDNIRWTETGLSGPGLLRGDPLSILWSVVPDGTSVNGGNLSTLINDYDNAYGVDPNDRTTDLSNRPWWQIFDEFFTRTTQLTGVTFVNVSDDGASWIGANGVPGVRGDMRISGYQDAQPPVGFTAFNSFPGNGVGGNMTINSAWTALYNTGGLRNVSAHEHLHGLGLNHVDITGINVQMEAGGRTQFDDLFALQRLYGDALEKNGGNDSSATATFLGDLGSAGSAARGTHTDDEFIAFSQTDFISIDGSSDSDWFKFTVNSAAVDITVTPKGPTYDFTPEGGSLTTLVASQQSDLIYDLYDAFGRRLLRQNSAGLGGTETLSGIRVREPGDYFLRVSGQQDKIQFYRVDVAAVAAIPTANANLVFRDNFDAGTSPDENLARIPTRQGEGYYDSPIKEGSTDVGDTSVSLVSDQLQLRSTGDGTGANQAIADFTRNFSPQLAGNLWSASFDVALSGDMGIGDSWFGFIFNDQFPAGAPFSETAEMSMLLRLNGSVQIRENGGNDPGEASFAGNVSGTSHSIDLIIDETGVQPLMDVKVNGQVLVDDEPISFGEDGRYFTMRAHTGGTSPVGLSFDALIDNFEIQLLPTVFLPGDFDENGSVDSLDLAAWEGGYGLSTGAMHNDGDANVDGDVDGLDFLEWQRDFGQLPPTFSSVTVVPEPASILLTGITLVVMLTNRTRI